ncbi:hypothetical protein [Streptomyces sp. ALI-76-A]|uniref:hypothetical protein n=1 Tax=Streptomyces sp. ALI-76-A TaxID=3025736 RepID=UPI00256EC5B9|nr:hypothetical protein [Streptomyces sp. ALI-76-A]MDL5199415.1 hypothetical protein [Streptomyces sp. ALI-76-A]
MRRHRASGCPRWACGGRSGVWLLSAAARAVDGSYGLAALMLALALTGLLTPLSLRRHQRQLDDLERALGRPAQSPPS